MKCTLSTKHIIYTYIYIDATSDRSYHSTINMILIVPLDSPLVTR